MFDETYEEELYIELYSSGTALEDEYCSWYSGHNDLLLDLLEVYGD